MLYICPRVTQFVSECYKLVKLVKLFNICLLYLFYLFYFGDKLTILLNAARNISC